MEEEKLSLVEKFERELAVLITIQHLGKATKEEIKEYVQKMKSIKGEPFKLQIRSINTLCEKLRSRSLISMNYESEKDGQKIVYSMQKGYVKFPEVAQIKDVIKEPQLQTYLNQLDNSAGAKKQKNVNDYYLCRVKWEVVDGVAGFYPNENKVNIHYRNNEGNIIFFPNHFKKYIEKNLAIWNKSAYIKDKIGVTYGKANLNGTKLYVDEHFVSVRGDIRGFSGGSGSKGIEILPAGSQIETKFSVPSNEFKSEDFKEFLEYIGEFGNKGFGAYCSRWGKLKLIDFEVIKKTIGSR